MVQKVPFGEKVYTSYPYNRPSLNFYSQHQVLPAAPKQLKRLWRKQKPAYLLVDRSALSIFDGDKRIVDEASGWLLITKDKI